MGTFPYDFFWCHIIDFPTDYLKLDQQAEQPEEPAVYTDKLAWGMA